MSDKNKLQEFFQKKGLPTPVYHTSKVGGTDDKPKWVCIIKLFNGEIIYSTPCSSKRACEMEAATKALVELNSNNLDYKKVKYRFDIDSKVVILVDGENLSTIPIKFATEVYTSASLRVYISKGHPIKPKLDQHEIKIVEVDSTRKDAVDIAIVMDSVRLYSDHIIIVTNDHFGSSLVELINKENRLVGHLARNYEDLLSLLQSLSLKS
jgi:hypothetical protein